ncbi:MAG: DNA translocase FtsK, partial [Pseudomonadota bacterium]
MHNNRIRKSHDLSSKSKPGARVSRRLQEVFGILTLACALLVGPSLFTVQFGSGSLMGPLGHWVGWALNWSLGLAGYLLVLALLVVSIRIFAGALGNGGRTLPLLAVWCERLGLLAFLLFGAVLLHLGFRPFRLGGASVGGAAGEIVGEVLCSFLSTPGSWVIALTGMTLSLVLTTNLSIASCTVGSWQLFKNGWKALVEGVLRVGPRINVFLVLLRHRLVQLRQSRELLADSAGTMALPPVVRLDFSSLEEEEEKPQSKKGKSQKVEIKDSNIAETEPEVELEPPTIAVPSNTILENKSNIAQLLKKEKVEKNKKEEHEDLPIVEAKFQTGTKEVTDSKAISEKRVKKTGGPSFMLKHETYRLPPISLLKMHDGEEATVNKEAIYEQAELLVKTLADYKITGRVTKVHPGPIVTMYEFVPAPGTRVNKVANLANDLAMSLKALRVRIVAPIPGKGAIGIEVPNEKRETVSIKEIVAHEVFEKTKARLPLALGKNIFGAPVVVDLAEMPHLLVAGATGAGKSVGINAMICSLLLKHSPEEMRLILIDPKFLELSGYNGIPHLLHPVVTDPKKASIALRWAVAEMERRYQTLADMRVRDIVAYNKKVDRLLAEMDSETDSGPRKANEISGPGRVTVVRKNADGTEELMKQVGAEDPTGESACVSSEGGAEIQGDIAEKTNKDVQRLPYIVVVIDEFADLMMAAPKDVETSLARLAQKARAAGIHLVVATQRPSVDVITGLIKANFPSRIAFQVASVHDSKTILSSQGAENLLGSGDMLMSDRGTQTRRLHGAYIGDEEIRGISDWLREQGNPVYDMEILKAPERED